MKLRYTHVDMEEGVLGKANNNGTIIIDQDLSPLEAKQMLLNMRKCSYRSNA